jgi:hypothetical protein
MIIFVRSVKLQAFVMEMQCDSSAVETEYVNVISAK